MDLGAASTEANVHPLFFGRSIFGLHLLIAPIFKWPTAKAGGDNRVMLRIFLVIEDISLMNSLKVTFLKLGCQVETLGGQVGLKERILAFRPEVLVTSGSGKKVNPLVVCQKVRESEKDLKVVLLLTKGTKLTLEELANNRYDAFIEAPFDPLRLLTTLKQFAKNPNVDLVDKFLKINSTVLSPESDSKIKVTGKYSESNEKISVFGSKFSSAVDDAGREKKYKQLTAKIKTSPRSTISKAEATKKLADLKKDWDFNELEEIDREKRRIVKELFRKK